MPEMAALTTITRDSLRAFWKHRLLWWLSIPVGVFIGISSFASREIQGHLTDFSDLSSLISFLADSGFSLAIGLLFLALLCQSALRGPLVTLFAHRMHPMNGAVQQKNIPWPDVRRAFGFSVGFEVAYWTLLTGIGAMLSLPGLIARSFNPSVMPAIFELGFLLLLTLGVYLYFIKELSCLYALLGKIRFRSALDLGFRLFRRQAFNTTLFFFYAALLALVFSLVVEFVFQLGNIPTTEVNLAWTIFLSIPFSLYFVFDQILRVSFFQTIATTPKKPVPKEVVLETTQTPSGISPS